MMITLPKFKVVFLLLGGTALLLLPTHALHQQAPIHRRDALASAASFFLVPSIANGDDTAVDMAAINAARSKGMFGAPTNTPEKPTFGSNPSETKPSVDLNNFFRKPRPLPNQHAVVPMSDPPTTIKIKGGLDNKAAIAMPRTGFSLYQTPSSEASKSVAVALKAGVRHLDVATQYGTNDQVAPVLAKYLSVGPEALAPFLKGVDNVAQLDAVKLAGEEHGQKQGGAKLAPAPSGSAGRRGRRDELFLSHKVSNAEQEQSTDPAVVRRAVKATIAQLRCSYLDLVSLHSPLVSKEARLASYGALLDLREAGFVKAVGVANFGVAALEEILNADLDLPAVNQLELTPFQTHSEVVEWCDKYGIAVTCSAVGSNSLSQCGSGWEDVVQLAARKQMTPNQVVARWALQRGTGCLSSAATAVECSYGGLNSSPNSVLTPEEIKMLDSLNINYPAAKLGRQDGWETSDVAGESWDPTLTP